MGKKHLPAFVTSLIVTVCLGILALASCLIYLETTYADKILPKTSIGNFDVGGLTAKQALEKMESYFKLIEEKGIETSYKETKLSLPIRSLTLDPDSHAHADIISLSAADKIKTALDYGRTGSLFQQYAEHLMALFVLRKIPAAFVVDKDSLAWEILQNFKSFEKKPVNASYRLDLATRKLLIVPEQGGGTFNFDAAHQSLLSSIERQEIPRISLEFVQQRAAITRDILTTYESRANEVVSNASLTLSVEGKKWLVAKKELAEWISVDTATGITLNPDEVTEYLKKNVAPTVFIETQDPRFTITEGKLAPVKLSQNGKELDINESMPSIVGAVMRNQLDAVQLIVRDVNSSLNELPAVEMELLAQGETDFKGSPANRKKNIARGMELMSGRLVRQGEEFSLIRILGPIDGTNGFLPELVIKQKKTTPEFGGGLCQVSTTLFRAVAYSGLPVTERRNHSYRVSYYEPPVGFDATIYDPAPDFKFKNDSPGYVLILAWTEGTKAHVQLWGNKDGRTVEVDKPTVYNITSPGPTRLIETADLKPGEKKCTEKAHPGADANFERRVTYADGILRKETFSSHYVAWPAVCLIGKAEVAELPQEQTTTPETFPDPSQQAIPDKPLPQVTNISQ